MADNVAITAGTGTSIAADDIGGVLHQRVKLIIGADGVNDGDVSATNPIPVKSPGIVHLTPTVTVTAGAYSADQCVGGKISIANAARNNSGSGIIQSALITVKTALTAPFDVFFFDTDPSNSTFTDNSALAINTADLPFLIGVAHCTDLVSGGTPKILQALNLAIPFKLSAAATTLYAVIAIRGGQTFASTSAIQASFGILQD